jgi:hypothetical protein
VKVTPFNSANGIFIDWIFSSGVISPPAFLSSDFLGRMDGSGKSGNDL